MGVYLNSLVTGYVLGVPIGVTLGFIDYYSSDRMRTLKGRGLVTGAATGLWSFLYKDNNILEIAVNDAGFVPAFFGGATIGRRLAQRLEKRNETKVVELSNSR